MNKNVIIIGAGGHSKVIADIIVKSQDNVLGFLDDNIPIDTVIIKEKNLKVLGKIEDSLKIKEKNTDIEFVIGIGNSKTRKAIAEKYPNLTYYTAIHPSSQIALDVKIEDGTVVMANTCINTSTKIGKHCIINTGAIIEHDNEINDYVHISPNATLCGTVKIGEITHIGAGATIKNNIKICNDCVIGAGAVVVKNIERSGKYIGIPSKKLKKGKK